MQRLVLICCLIGVTMLTSCGFYEHRARILLCKQITETNDSLDKLTRQWHLLLDKAVKVRNFSSLNATRIKIGQFISRRRSAIANMEMPQDAETLRESEGNFLSAQAAMVADVYPLFESYTDLTPEDKIQNSLRLVAKDMDTEMAWNVAIRKSMDAFIKKNKLKIPK